MSITTIGPNEAVPLLAPFPDPPRHPEENG